MPQQLSSSEFPQTYEIFWADAGAYQPSARPSAGVAFGGAAAERLAAWNNAQLSGEMAGPIPVGPDEEDDGPGTAVVNPKELQRILSGEDGKKIADAQTAAGPANVDFEEAFDGVGGNDFWHKDERKPDETAKLVIIAVGIVLAFCLGALLVGGRNANSPAAGQKEIVWDTTAPPSGLLPVSATPPARWTEPPRKPRSAQAMSRLDSSSLAAKETPEPPRDLKPAASISRPLPPDGFLIGEEPQPAMTIADAGQATPRPATSTAPAADAAPSPGAASTPSRGPSATPPPEEPSLFDDPSFKPYWEEPYYLEKEALKRYFGGLAAKHFPGRKDRQDAARDIMTFLHKKTSGSASQAANLSIAEVSVGAGVNDEKTVRRVLLGLKSKHIVNIRRGLAGPDVDTYEMLQAPSDTMLESLKQAIKDEGPPPEARE